MSKFTKVVLTIACVCIGIGLVMGTAGYLLGGWNGIAWDGERLQVMDPSEDSRQEVRETISQELKSIVIDVNMADVSLRISDHYGIEMTYYEPNNKLEYQVSGDTLQIQSENRESGFLFQMGFFTQKTPTVTVYLPESAVLEKLEVNNGCGDLSVQGITAQEMILNLSLGDLSLKGLSAQELKAKNDCGDITLEESFVKTLEVSLRLGDLSMNAVEADRVTGISNDCGDIDLNHCTFETVEILQDNLGDIKAQDLTVNGIVVENDSGSVDLYGKLSGDIQAKVNLGDLNLTVLGNRQDYMIKANTDLGDVTVDGEEKPAYESGPSAANKIDAQADCGDVEIDFE